MLTWLEFTGVRAPRAAVLIFPLLLSSACVLRELPEDTQGGEAGAASELDEGGATDTDGALDTGGTETAEAEESSGSGGGPTTTASDATTSAPEDPSRGEGEVASPPACNLETSVEVLPGPISTPHGTIEGPLLGFWYQDRPVCGVAMLTSRDAKVAHDGYPVPRVEIDLQINRLPDDPPTELRCWYVDEDGRYHGGVPAEEHRPSGTGHGALFANVSCLAPGWPTELEVFNALSCFDAESCPDRP